MKLGQIGQTVIAIQPRNHALGQPESRIGRDEQELGVTQQDAHARHLYQAALIVARWIGPFMGSMQDIDRIGNLLFEWPGLPECKELLGL